VSRVAFWLATLSILAIAAASCGTDPQLVAGPGALGHIHDMVLDSDGELLVASHSGLYRIDGIERAVLVNEQQHDLMSMTMLDSGDLLVGGHPDLRLEEYMVDERPPFLGLTRSGDGGQTWEVVDLLGDADFHALAPTTAGLFAAETSGVIMHRTADGVWTELGTVEAADLAVNPSNVAEQVAPDYDASLWASVDGAVTWAPVEGAPSLVEVEWPLADELVGIDESGALWTAIRPSGPWTRTAIGPADAETLLVDETGSWWVSVDGATIGRSEDRGQTWTTVYTPPS
jgi:hypothetical protein